MNSEADFDPYAKKEVVSLIPNRCTECKFARFIIELEVVHELHKKNIAKMSQYMLGSLERVKNIQETCSGYEGSDPSSDMYSEAFDRSGCPYALLLEKER